MDGGRLADWQLPIGVDRALWDYAHDHSIAWDYDEYFAGHNLLRFDQQFLERHFRVPGRLIDLGCGTGRVLERFAQRGFEVVGVDLSAEMLGVCAKKLAAERERVDLIRANFCDLAALRGASFDYATSMFSSLGMVAGPAWRRRALAEVHRILRPGGLFAFHVHNRWYNLTDPQGRRWLCVDLLKRLAGRPDAGDKVMPNYRGIPRLRLHVFSSREVRRELRRAGFSRVEQVPLSSARQGPLAAPWILGALRANGWLFLFQKSSEKFRSPRMVARPFSA